MLTGRRVRIAFRIVTDAGEHSLSSLLLFSFLPEATFFTVRYVKWMVSGWICSVAATFYHERVRLTSFNVDFGNEFVIEPPGNTPRRMTLEIKGENTRHLVG